MIQTRLKCKDNLCGAMAKVLVSSFKMSEFEVQSCYYIHLQDNNMGKDVKPIKSPVKGYIVSDSVLLWSLLKE